MDKNGTKSHRSTIIEFFRTWCAYLFLQYELITCTCMFEPWEKILINSIILMLFSLVTYSSFMYLPQYLASLFTCFSQMTGAVTTMPFEL